MKKAIFIFLMLACLAPLAAAKASTGTDLKQKLMGRIVLAVESHGEAYYISPKDGQIIYLGRPADAYNLMRNQGLGISEKDYYIFKASKLQAKRLSGRIVLRVQAKGEAYYINPLTLTLNYLGNADLAYSTIRSYGLGISNTNLDLLLGRTLDRADTNITYLVSKSATTNYCNGTKMDSAGYRKTITSQVITDTPKDKLVLGQLAKQTVILATTGMCQTVMKEINLTVVDGVAQIPPIDAWAGVSIAMCSCVPQVEVNLLRIPGINSVVWQK